MGSIYTQTIGAIFDNYADVIEGGNTHRGSGADYFGIAGTRSNSDQCFAFTATTGGGFSIGYSSAGSYENAAWVKSDTPGFFLLCTLANASENVGAVRRIGGWNDTNKIWTITDAWPGTSQASDEFETLQGFRRLPDNFDINDPEIGVAGGFDRMFELTAGAGSRMPWYGNGYEHYKTTFELRLRMLKKSRRQKTLTSVFENLMILRSVLTRKGNRDGTYTQLLTAEDTEPEVITDDLDKVVIADRYGLVYRVDSSFL